MDILPLLSEPTKLDRRRKRREATIRWMDITISVVVFISGLLAIFATPYSAANSLPVWLVYVWAGFLLVGGLMGAVGRLTRIWAIEIPGICAGVVGIAMYFVLLLTSPRISLASYLIMGLVLIAFLCLSRRYIELQIFTTEPGPVNIVERIRIIFSRRTPNYRR